MALDKDKLEKWKNGRSPEEVAKQDERTKQNYDFAASLMQFMRLSGQHPGDAASVGAYMTAMAIFQADGVQEKTIEKAGVGLVEDEDFINHSTNEIKFILEHLREELKAGNIVDIRTGDTADPDTDKPKVN